MSKINEKEVKNISVLARLELSDTETKKFQCELSHILDYAEKINSAPTEGIEPMANITGMSDVVREDKKVPSKLSRDEILSNAPDIQNGYIKTKSVLENFQF